MNDVHLDIHIVKHHTIKIILGPRLAWILILIGIAIAVIDIVGVMLSVV